MTAPGPAIQKGSIFIYRVFDIAEEINLHRVTELLEQRARDSSKSGGSRLGLARSPRHALVMRAAPVRLSLGMLEVPIGGMLYPVEGFATIWDYGVVSILFTLSLDSGTPWSKLMALSDLLTDDRASNEAIDSLARQRAKEIREMLHDALQAPAERELLEDYVIYFLEEIEGIKRGDELMDAVDVPALILGETREELAEKSRAAILDTTVQYAENDLVVIDWNSAVVLEPSGQRDIADVIEFALTHLLEFRYYDDLLDARLGSLYDAIVSRRKSNWRFAQLAHEANSRFIEFSEFIERVDNSLKVVGDFYLAVVFRAAITRLRIRDWQASVTRKMNLLARVSELLQGEVNVRRGHTLEIIVIILIAFEIVSAILKSV